LGELVQTVKRCRHLQNLSIEWTESEETDVLELIDFVEARSRIKTLSLSIDLRCDAEKLANLAERAGFRKCVHRLKLYHFPRDICVENLISCIIKLSELKRLHLIGMKGLKPDLLFQHLPNLERLVAVSCFHVDLMKIFPARFHFETSYVKYTHSYNKFVTRKNIGEPKGVGGLL